MVNKGNTVNPMDNRNISASYMNPYSDSQGINPQKNLTSQQQSDSINEGMPTASNSYMNSFNNNLNASSIAPNLNNNSINQSINMGNEGGIELKTNNARNSIMRRGNENILNNSNINQPAYAAPNNTNMNRSQMGNGTYNEFGQPGNQRNYNEQMNFDPSIYGNRNQEGMSEQMSQPVIMNNSAAWKEEDKAVDNTKGEISPIKKNRKSSIVKFSDVEKAADSPSKKSSERKKSTLNVSVVLEEGEAQPEEKEKMKTVRQSKYTQMLKDTPDPQTEEKLKIALKELINSNNMGEIKRDQRLSILHYKENKKNKTILRFNRSKSMVPPKDELDPNKKFQNTNLGLSQFVRANFEKNKIRNMENPNNQEVFNDNKFIRDKTQITLFMNKLKEKIFMENYNDKNKLSMNVFEDFEKQTSWQSYTTLLITDIGNINDKKEYLLTKKSSGSKGKSFGAATKK